MSEYVPFHKSSKASEVYVEDGPKQEAMKRLHERIEAGESPYAILDIETKHKYYVDKIVAGLMPMSYAHYARIMNLDEEDAFDV